MKAKRKTCHERIEIIIAGLNGRQENYVPIPWVIDELAAALALPDDSTEVERLRAGIMNVRGSMARFLKTYSPKYRGDAEQWLDDLGYLLTPPEPVPDALVQSVAITKLPWEITAQILAYVRGEMESNGFNWATLANKITSLLTASPLQSKANYIDIVFDGPPSHESGRFVEVESPPGKSIKIGEWIHREDGFWALRFPIKPPLSAPCGTGDAAYEAGMNEMIAMLDTPQGAEFMETLGNFRITAITPAGILTELDIDPDSWRVEAVKP